MNTNNQVTPPTLCSLPNAIPYILHSDTEKGMKQNDDKQLHALSPYQVEQTVKDSETLNNQLNLQCASCRGEGLVAMDPQLLQSGSATSPVTVDRSTSPLLFTGEIQVSNKNFCHILKSINRYYLSAC